MLERIFNWLKPQKPKPEQRAITYEQGLAMGLVLEPTDSGISVNNEKPLTLSSMYSATRHIAEAVAALPKRVMKKEKDGGKTVDEDHPNHDLVAHEPNGYQTAPVYWEWFAAQAVIYGNSWAKIERDNSGRAIALHPLPALYVNLAWDVVSKKKSVHVIASPFTEAEELDDYEVLHVPGLSLDGLMGLNPVEYARQSHGLSIALEKFAASFYRNSCRPSGWLTKEGTLSDKARSNVKESWKRAYQGSGETGSVPLLEEGLEFHPNQISNDEGQFLETKSFQVSEASRWTKVPLVFLDPGRATWNNLELYNTIFVQQTLAPWIIKMEAELNRKLWLPSERGKYCFEFDMRGLLRGDTRTRYAAYQTALGGQPWMTQNEARLAEGLSPVEGGDELKAPLNMGSGSDDTEGSAEPETEEPKKPEEEYDKDGEVSA